MLKVRVDRQALVAYFVSIARRLGPCSGLRSTRYLVCFSMPTANSPDRRPHIALEQISFERGVDLTRWNIEQRLRVERLEEWAMSVTPFLTALPTSKGGITLAPPPR